MKKIPRDDPRAKYMSSDRTVSAAELAEFVRDRHRWVLATTRSDGRPQMSLVSGGMLPDGRLAIASYPSRAKVKNVKANSLVSVAVMGDEFNNEWVQIDGRAIALDVPDGLDEFVEYFRSISGEHSDWDEYRQAMIDQNKSIILIDIERWGPVSQGGFPPSLFESS